jgi:uncharacterized protein YgiB involved in biofilm formation
LLRSAGFWFPLFVGFLCVQIMGAGNLISDSFQFSRRKKQKLLASKK